MSATITTPSVAPISIADYIGQQTNYGRAAGNNTVGVAFQVLSPKSAAGVKVWLDDSATRSIKVAIWAGGVSVASKTMDVAGPGEVTIPFDAPLALTVGMAYIVSMWVTTGDIYYFCPTAPVPDLPPGIVSGSVIYGLPDLASNGDSVPNIITGLRFAVEVVLAA